MSSTDVVSTLNSKPSGRSYGSWAITSKETRIDPERSMRVWSVTFSEKQPRSLVLQWIKRIVRKSNVAQQQPHIVQILNEDHPLQALPDFLRYNGAIYGRLAMTTVATDFVSTAMTVEPAKKNYHVECLRVCRRLIRCVRFWELFHCFILQRSVIRPCSPTSE
jgi:hypothetical protein